MEIWGHWASTLESILRASGKSMHLRRAHHCVTMFRCIEARFLDGCLSETLLGGFTMDFEGYCVKCRKKQMIKDGVVEENAKGRRMAKGVCPECSAKVTRFLPSKKSE